MYLSNCNWLMHDANAVGVFQSISIEDVGVKTLVFNIGKFSIRVTALTKQILDQKSLEALSTWFNIETKHMPVTEASERLLLEVLRQGGDIPAYVFAGGVEEEEVEEDEDISFGDTIEPEDDEDDDEVESDEDEEVVSGPVPYRVYYSQILGKLDNYSIDIGSMDSESDDPDYNYSTIVLPAKDLLIFIQDCGAIIEAIGKASAKSSVMTASGRTPNDYTTLWCSVVNAHSISYDEFDGCDGEIDTSIPEEESQELEDVDVSKLVEFQISSPNDYNSIPMNFGDAKAFLVRLRLFVTEMEKERSKV